MRLPIHGPVLVACLAFWGTSTALAQDEVATAPEGSSPPGTEAEARTDEPRSDAALDTIPVKPRPTQDDGAALAREPEPANAIAEVIVTATKRPESVREIPASITALRGEDLERKGIQGAEDLVKLVPGVNMTTAGDSASRITIRGISADPATNSTTGVIFGDVSFTDNYLPFVTLDPNPFDLRTVEVLKGPQGTLFGAGALNGAIRYVPEPPELGVFGGKYFVQYTSVSHGGADPIYGAALNVPIGDDWAARAVGFDRRSPGYIDDTRSGKDNVNRTHQTGARGMVRGEFGDGWSLRMMYAWQATQIADTSIADNADGNLSHHNRPRPSPQHNHYWVADINLGYHMDWADFVSESAYVDKGSHQFVDASSRLMASGDLPLLGQLNTSASQTWSQELRLVSVDDPDSRWKWVGGLFGSRQDIQSMLFYPLGDASLPITELVPALNAAVPGLGALVASDGYPNAGTIANNVRVDELALFADVTRRLGERWELSLGGRLYRTSSGGLVTQSGVLLDAENADLQHENQGEIDQAGFNPKASLMWHATDSMRVYAAASRGFRAGGLQPGFTAPGSTKTAPQQFKSDSLWNYELGWRSDGFGGATHLDVTGFLTQWKNPQTLQVGTGSIPSSYLDNAGGVESHGIEAALQTLLPVKGLSLISSAAYAKTVTTKNFVGSDGSNVPIGTSWPYAPRWQTATTLAYDCSVDGWDLGAGVTHTFLGKARDSLVASENHAVFGFQQWDLQFTASRPSLSWLPEFSLAVNNLTDERGISFRYDGNGYTDVNYIRPLAVTLRLGGKF